MLMHIPGPFQMVRVDIPPFRLTCQLLCRRFHRFIFRPNFPKWQKSFLPMRQMFGRMNKDYCSKIHYHTFHCWIITIKHFSEKEIPLTGGYFWQRFVSWGSAAQPHEIAPANFNLYWNWHYQLVWLRIYDEIYLLLTHVEGKLILW